MINNSSFAFAQSWLQGKLEKQNNLQSVLCPLLGITEGKKEVQRELQANYNNIGQSKLFNPMGLGALKKTQSLNFYKGSKKND